MPTAAVVAGPEPEIAPKNRHAITVAAEIPPVNGPASVSATAISRRDRPAASISAPARMNEGSAISGKDPTEDQAICTILIGLSPRYHIEASAETPSATVIGAPRTIRNTKVPNRISTR